MAREAMSQSMAQELAQLRAENEKLKATALEKSTSRISYKVALPRPAGKNGPQDKGSLGGSLSVYGLGRFPTTLYKEQWIRLLACKDDILEFIEAHDSELSVK